MADILTSIADILWIPAFILLVGFGIFSLYKVLSRASRK